MRSRLLATVTAGLIGLGALVGLTLGTTAPASAAAQVFPVPTSAAGLGRIVTAPNGNMWFVEREVSKVGRITPQGQISEYQLPFTSDIDAVEDLDVAPDGTIWVLYESGERVAQLDGNGTVLRTGRVGQFGESIRVAPDNTVWITVSFDREFVVRISNGTISELPNSPECTDSLGRAGDGVMWCRTSSGLTRLNAAGGGTTYPANKFAAYPYAIAAGPVGSIWFGRYFGGTIFTSPDDGEVGYLDAASGAITAFNTGERTAPADLVRGPDNAMWFASIGAAKGIGHLNAAGQGALTQVGGYAPRSLTFGPDGAVWFTDAANNVIVRVATSELQVTNVDPGAGSVFAPGVTGATSGVNAGLIKVQGAGKPIRARGTKVPVTLSCPKKATGGCRTTVTLRTAKKVRLPGTGKKSAKAVQVVSKAAAVRIRAGKQNTVTLTLDKNGKKLVRRGRTTQLRVLLDGSPTKKIAVRR